MMGWPFSIFFLDLYHLARTKDWRWKDKPVTIAWLLGYYSGACPNLGNMFRPGSLAWFDFKHGRESYYSEPDKYLARR
jgi:hypothetical protein